MATNGNGQPYASLPSTVHLPDASYTWKDAATPNVVYQFATSSQVVGSPPTPLPHARGSFTSHDLVGSSLQPVVGTLTATIEETGKVILLHNGGPPKNLKPGRYKLTVVSHDPGTGFAIERAGSHTAGIARGPFRGRRTAFITLSAGTWIFIERPGKASASFVIR